MVTAAGVGHKALKATRITAKLADTLADLTRRTQALAKLSKLRRYLRGMDKAKWGEWKGGRSRAIKSLMRGDGVDPKDIGQWLAYKQGKKLVQGVTGMGIGPAIGSLVNEGLEQGQEVAIEGGEYAVRPDSKGFDERMDETPQQAGKSVRDAFG